MFEKHGKDSSSYVQGKFQKAVAYPGFPVGTAGIMGFRMHDVFICSAELSPSVTCYEVLHKMQKQNMTMLKYDNYIGLLNEFCISAV